MHVVKLSYSISSVLNFRTNFFAFVYEFTNRANLVLIENVERFVETRMVKDVLGMKARLQLSSRKEKTIRLLGQNSV